VAAKDSTSDVTDWKAREDSFNDNTREEDPAGVGLTYETMVELNGALWNPLKRVKRP